MITNEENTDNNLGDEMADKELVAMSKISNALKGLDESEKERVLQWAVSKHIISSSVKSMVSFQDPRKVQISNAAKLSLASDNENSDVIEINSFKDLPTFFDALSPKTDADKALVTSYWFQKHESQSDINSQDVNTQLKHLGYGIGNVTRAFDNLKSEKLVIQIKKDGTSKQARKKFKLTHQGMKKVEEMISQVLSA